MFCIKCGKQLPDEAAFCFACGAPVFKGGDTAPVVSPASDFEGITTFTPPAEDGNPSVAKDATVDLGNFFIDGEKMYFITHGYREGLHSQLWESDLNGTNKKCVLDFDQTKYEPVCLFEGDGSYYMAKVDRLIIVQVFDANNDYFNYYYHLDNKTHGIIKDAPHLPYRASQNGKYFVDCLSDHDNEDGSVIIKLSTPWGFLNNKPCENIHLKPIDLPVLYTSYENIRFNESDCYVFNGRQLLISFYGDAEYRWLRLDLDNWSDTAVLSPARFLIDGYGTQTGEGSLVLFSVSGSGEYVCVDTEDMGIRAAIPMPYASIVNKYGSLVHFTSYNSEEDLLLDLKTGGRKRIPQNIKVFGSANIKDVRQTANGFYKYSYDGGETKIYFMPNTELFKEFNGDTYDDNECVLPIISLVYHVDFKPVLRNAAADENIYTYTNTKDLDVASSEYLETTNKDLFDRLSYSSFFYSNYITLPDGKRIGFTYGHKKGFEGCKDYYYNLYELKLDGTYNYLNCGSRGGIEYLLIYKNYAYWTDVLTYRYDFTTGEFIESHDEELRKEYEHARNMASQSQILCI